MTVIRVKGFKIFKDRHGKMRCYHRVSGTAIDLVKVPLGSVEFVAECVRIGSLSVPKAVEKAGTLGALIVAYRGSTEFSDLAPRTRKDYQGKLDYLQPLHDMALVKLDTPFVVAVRDKASKKHGRRFGNYVKAVLSVLCSWGVERGWLKANPASKVRNIRRQKDAPHANRPWSDAERFAVLDAAPPHIRVPIALGMYVGLREGDALRLPKSAIADGVVTLITAKSRTTVAVPVLSHLETILAEGPKHKVGTVAVTSRGTTWTESGFRASWRKVRLDLEKAGRVQPGLTFHGLRHSVATILREAGIDPRTIADALGQKTEGMALHYSKRADLKRNMARVAEAFEASETEARAKRTDKPAENTLSNHAKTE